MDLSLGEVSLGLRKVKVRTTRWATYRIKRWSRMFRDVKFRSVVQKVLVGG